MRGRQPGFEVRLLSRSVLYLLRVSVVASSIAITSYSSPKYWSMSLSFLKWPMMIRLPLAKLITPVVRLYSCGVRLRIARRKSSNCSRAFLAILRMYRTFSPSHRWQSSSAICAKMANDFPGPRAPPKPIWSGPSSLSANRQAA